jgi:hypothetical protein
MISLCGIRPSIIFIGWFMGHVNSSINPIIYFIFNENFRREVVKMLGSVRDACSRRKRSSLDKPLPVSKRATATQSTNNTSVSSNEDNNGGKSNDAFEMVSESGAAVNGSAVLTR